MDKNYKRRLSFLFKIIIFIFIASALIKSCGNPLPDLLDPKSIDLPVYPNATRMYGWPKEKKPGNPLGIGLWDDSPYPDYYLGYEVPETGAEPILKFYSDELAKRDWMIKKKPEESWDSEYHIRSYNLIYIKNTMELNLWVHVYYRKPKNIFWYFKKSVPSSVRISIYK